MVGFNEAALISDYWLKSSKTETEIHLTGVTYQNKCNSNIDYLDQNCIFIPKVNFSC